MGNRIQRLINNNVVKPERALFAIERPTPDRADFVQVYEDIVDKIKQLGVKVNQFANTAGILQFAKADLPENPTPDQRH